MARRRWRERSPQPPLKGNDNDDYCECDSNSDHFNSYIVGSYVPAVSGINLF